MQPDWFEMTSSKISPSRTKNDKSLPIYLVMFKFYCQFILLAANCVLGRRLINTDTRFSLRRALQRRDSFRAACRIGLRYLGTV